MLLTVAFLYCLLASEYSEGRIMFCLPNAYMHAVPQVGGEGDLARFLLVDAIRSVPGVKTLLVVLPHHVQYE